MKRVYMAEVMMVNKDPSAEVLKRRDSDSARIG